MILKLLLTSLVILLVSFFVLRYSIPRTTEDLVSGVTFILSLASSIILGILWIWFG